MDRTTLNTIITNVFTSYNPYLARVMVANSSIRNHRLSKSFMEMCEENNMGNPYIQFAWLGEAASSFRTSGIYQYFTNLYSTYLGNTYTEKVTNGGFDADTNWAKGTGVTISGGTLNSNGTITAGSDMATQANALSNPINKTYRVTYTISNYTAGSVKIGCGGYAYSTAKAANGTYQENIIVTNIASSNSIYITCTTASFNGSIDNVSVQEITPSSLAYDAVQATSTSQPLLKGNIAPNERWGMYNANGGNNFMTHLTISYAATDAWSVTTAINSNGRFLYGDGHGAFTGGINGNGKSSLTISYNGLTYFFINSIGSEVHWNGILGSGKSNIFTLTAYGNGTIELFENGGSLGVKNIITSISYNQLMNGYIGTTYYNFCGKLYAHIIRSQTLSQSQVTAEYNFFRSLYPEIPSVTIGTQTWSTSNFEAICTPQGNVIQEMQANSNVELMTSGDFESGLIGSLTSGDETSSWTLNTTNPISGTKDGLLAVTVIGTTLGRPRVNFTTTTLPVIGNYYRVKFDYKLNSGICNINYLQYGGATYTGISSLTGTGSIIFYVKATSTVNQFYLAFNGNNLFNLQLDNVSVQSVGWSDSQNLYDSIYAATSGTTEQKTYAAVKAASMWCHYNNDVALGAVYGKLYNWFAVKLLQMDIDYYNTANPTTPWGWKTPTATDISTLSTYLGGDTISGGKLKKDGIIYINTPNTGADNSSGFSAIANGYRNTTGVFSQIGNYITGWGVNIDNSPDFSLINNVATMTRLTNDNKIQGLGLRLIKS